MCAPKIAPALFEIEVFGGLVVADPITMGLPVALMATAAVALAALSWHTGRRLTPAGMALAPVLGCTAALLTAAQISACAGADQGCWFHLVRFEALVMLQLGFGAAALAWGALAWHKRSTAVGAWAVLALSTALLCEGVRTVLWAGRVPETPGHVTASAVGVMGVALSLGLGASLIAWRRRQRQGGRTLAVLWAGLLASALWADMRLLAASFAEAAHHHI